MTIHLPLKEDNLSIMGRMIHPMCLLFRGSTVLQGFPETTTVEAMNEAHRLKDDFLTRQTHKLPVNVDNFTQSLAPRHTGIYM